MSGIGYPDSNDDASVILGAGPAGLTAAWELCKAGRPVLILEQDPVRVGGLSRTVDYKGFRFDIGGHRFFSKNPEIEALWTDILGDRMLVRERLSRIYYRGRLFKYPLEIWDTLKNLGPSEAAACVLSYLQARRRPNADLRNFEDWVTHAFGSRLHHIFFKTYTEKVWGIPCTAISADWAAQRIRGLSMLALFKAAVRWPWNGDAPIIKTLVNRFRYPINGPGEMWEALAERIRRRGAALRLGERVTSIQRSGRAIRCVVTNGPDGERRYCAGHFVSTMPIRELIAAMDPPPTPAIKQAAASLKYRDFLTVALILDQAEVFPDQWIYIHEPGVAVGRIQNFKNWSPAMVPDQRFTVLGLEYFCFEWDGLWRMPDHELIAMARRELAALGLARAAAVVDGVVVRQRAAYPVYDHEYRGRVDRVRRFLESEACNLQLAGRNGMHKYNNQDHAMMTGLMAARNIMGASYDPWRVNSDALYLEEDSDGELGSRLVPMSVAAEEIAPPASPEEEDEG
jgi:protoporphyrinogen oxidase